MSNSPNPTLIVLMAQPILYFPGVFDLISHRHFTLFQYYKAKLPNACLVLGVFSDQDAVQVAGKVVLCAEEREESVRACKWVDKVICPCPRLYSIDYLRANQVSFVCVAGKLIPPQDAIGCAVDYKSQYSELRATLAMAGRFIAKKSAYMSSKRRQIGDENRDARLAKQQDHLRALEEALTRAPPGPTAPVSKGLLAFVQQAGEQLSRDVIDSLQNSWAWANSFF